MDHFELFGVGPDSTDDEVRDAYRRLARSFHPDAHPGASGSDAARLHEAMARINAAYEEIRTEERRRAYAARLDAGLLDEDVEDVGMRPPGAEECTLCGWGPVWLCKFRYQVAYLFGARVSSLEGIFCRDCGAAIGRSYQNRTLWLGWWGMLSFFRNLYYVWANARDLWDLKQLPEPKPVPDVVAPLLMPLLRGRPVLARSGAWAVAAAAALVLAGAVTESQEQQPGFDPYTATIDLDSDAQPVDESPSYLDRPTWERGVCVRFDGAFVEPVHCGFPHDGVVESVEISESFCPFTSDSYVEDGGLVYCIDEN